MALVAVLIVQTVPGLEKSEATAVTYARMPSGVIAMPTGLPTVREFTTVLVAVLMTQTVPARFVP